MSSSGPNSPGTASSPTRAGSNSLPWSSLGNVFASDNTRAQLTSSGFAASYTDWLKVTNFGFAIPGGSTIDGVVVEIERAVSSADTGPKDSSVQLVKGGTISSTDKASASTWPTSDTYASYGGATDLWGLSLTDTDVNASDFGVALSVYTNTPGKLSCAYFVDHIRITVYYTAGGGGSSVKTLAAMGVG